MSWAEEDWTVGLSGRVLQKVKELQVHHERLSRENKQKQLHLDNLQTSLEKQNAKYEEVRGELQAVQRELRSAGEEVKAAVTSRDRLSQDVQTKQAQVCSLEGQLDALHNLNNKLTQEIKRLEAELEKLQNSTRLTDSTLFSTPSWNTNSPWEHSGSRQEGRSEQRDETRNRAHHSRQRLLFSDVSTPQQQHKSTPHRHSSDQSEIFSTPHAAFPWERDDSKPGARRRLPPSPQTPPHAVTNQVLSAAGDCGTNRNAETDKSLLEMQTRISSLEEELSSNNKRLKSVLNEQTQNKKELAAKEVSLQRAHDELSVAQARIAQEKEQASAAEHRLKQLQEELKCQRQNAESCRVQHQQRTKELEKQHQRDLTELQKERQILEKQHQQEVNKLNQELQQARTLHNALQAQADKLSLQKQALEKELESVKEKLKWTEGQLKESQKKETQTQAKLTEAVREAEGVAVSLEQSRKRERALEEEGKRLAEERADALRLLKELQEQKLVPATLPQPVQFCPVGQSVPPQSSFSQPPRTQTKKPAAPRAEQKRVEDEAVDERRASYPPDREPGEGIDSEDITSLTSSNSERLGRAGRQSNDREIKSPNEAEGSSVDGNSLRNPEHQQSLRLSEKKLPLTSQQSISSDDMKRENAMLRSELRDVQEELQKRLEDLETQRRAEIEARTRLKQLSRKHTSQAAEKEEKHKEWKTQLESERAESERLKKTIAALEAEIKKSRREQEKVEREQENKEKNKQELDRETEMIELNIQLKQQLAEVKAQLAVEREERKQEIEERSQVTNTDTEVKEELEMKVAELEAEVEELKRTAQEEEKLSAANNPLTYLSLREDELNSNIPHCDNNLLPSPEQHLLFCQSTNQRNILVSQAEILQGESDVIHPEDSPQSDVDHTLASDLENCTQDETDSPDWAKEVARLKKARAKETERANQCQGKLEALQGQVTRQTRQLTTAFEKQTQHISGLLAELQVKENALITQQQELLRCKKELEALKTEEVVKIVEEEPKKDEETLGQISVLLPKQEESPGFSPVAKTVICDELNAEGDPGQSKMKTWEAETQTLVSSEEDIEAVKQTETVKTERSQNEGTPDMSSELLDLRRENQQLKQRIDDLNVSNSRNTSLQADSEEASRQTQDAAPEAVSSLSEKTQNDVQAEGEDVDQSQDARQDVNIKDKQTSTAKEDLEGVSQPQIKLLQQEVAALQLRLSALSMETQQQAEELAVWRLSSQPPPTFIIEEQRDLEEQISAVMQTQHQRSDEDAQSQNQMPAMQIQTLTPGSPRRQEKISVIREDELLLSCSSNKLQGRMLFSRLQNLNLPEPKTLQTCKKTTTLQEVNQDTDNIYQEAEKENQEVNILQQSSASPTQHKVRKDTELLQMRQHHGTKDSLKVSETISTKAVSLAGNTEAKLNSSKGTNEVNTASESSHWVLKTETISVSSQTEESLRPPTLCVMTQTEEEEMDQYDDEELVESPPVSPVPLPEGAESGNQILFAGSFPIPADPARLAERILKNRTQLSAAYDDTEYEPYGLPEVVMKGFADIPTGPSCPYIVRRGLLGTTVVPAAPQKDSEKEEETD